LEAAFNPLVLLAIIWLFGPAAVLAFILWAFLAVIGLVLFGGALSLTTDSFSLIYNYFNSENINFPATELSCHIESYSCYDNDPLCLEKKHKIPSIFYVRIDKEKFAPDFKIQPTVNITYTNKNTLSNLIPKNNTELKIDLNEIKIMKVEDNEINVFLKSIDERNIFESNTYYEWHPYVNRSNRYYKNDDIFQASNKQTGGNLHNLNHGINYDISSTAKVCAEGDFIGNFIMSKEDTQKNKDLIFSYALRYNLFDIDYRPFDDRLIFIEQSIQKYFKANDMLILNQYTNNYQKMINEGWDKLDVINERLNFSYTISSKNHNENIRAISKSMDKPRYGIEGTTDSVFYREGMGIEYIKARIKGDPFIVESLDRGGFAFYYMPSINIQELKENYSYTADELSMLGLGPTPDFYRWCVDKIRVNRDTLKLTALTNLSSNPYTYKLKSDYQCDIISDGMIKKVQKESLNLKASAIKSLNKKHRKNKTEINLKEKKEKKNKI